MVDRHLPIASGIILYRRVGWRKVNPSGIFNNAPTPVCTYFLRCFDLHLFIVVNILQFKRYNKPGLEIVSVN